MNIFLIIAFVLAGGTIAVDHLIRRLPHWLAIVVYSAAVVLFVIGIIVSRNAGA